AGESLRHRDDGEAQPLGLLRFRVVAVDGIADHHQVRPGIEVRGVISHCGADSGALEQRAHRRIERPIGPANAMALLLQEARERSHPRTANRHAVDIELRRLHGRGFSFSGSECSISRDFIHLGEGAGRMQRHIKTVILALCAALLVAATVLAAGKPKAVAVEPIKDVGVVATGEKIVNDFLIRNDGDAVLEITNVQPACGCTVAEFDKSIAPGQTGKVHAVVDTTTFNGPIAKGVSVFTNDPDTPQIELTIRAKVEPYISVKPGYARYITVQGEPLEGSIAQTLWAPDGSSIEVTGVDSPWPFLHVSFREAKPEERVGQSTGKQWRVEMMLSN